MKVVKVLEAVVAISVATGKSQRRGMVVLQREDGHFTFAEEYSDTSEYGGENVAEGWQRLPSEGLFISAIVAEEEARSIFLPRHS